MKRDDKSHYCLAPHQPLWQYIMPRNDWGLCSVTPASGSCAIQPCRKTVFSSYFGFWDNTLPHGFCLLPLSCLHVPHPVVSREFSPLISFPANPLFTYKKATGFCLLIVCSTNTLNMFISAQGLHRITSSVFLILNLFSSLIVLAKISSHVLDKSE